MTRFLRLALVAVVLSALSVPAFAIKCSLCDPFLLVCVDSPDSGTRCRFVIDHCETIITTCNGVLDQDTLADTLAIASVEVVTPAGVKKTGDTPHLAARQSAAKTAAVSTFTR